MKRMLLVLFVITVCSFFINDVKAVGCGLEQRVKFNEIASKIRMTYEGNDITKVDADGEEYSVSVLDLKIYNVSDQLNYKLSDGSNSVDLDYSMSVDDVITVRITDISTIKNYVLEIYPTTYDCYTEKIRSIKITLPKYNYESSSEICNDIEDYYLCQKYITTELDEDTCYQNVQKYRDRKKDIKMEELELESSDNEIVKKITNYKYYILIGVLVLGMVISFVIVKKKGSV